jgi:anti-sigma regulatory factor (Ser/Thr protein kinase)
MDPDGDVYRLTVPASAGHLSTVRLFAAAVARQAGGAEDAVEDLRLAVSEACTIALQAARAPETLEIAMRIDPAGCAMEIRTTPSSTDVSEGGEKGGDPASAGIDGLDPAEGWWTDLLEAIVSGLKLEPRDDGQIGVTFVSPIGPERQDTVHSGSG